MPRKKLDIQETKLIDVTTMPLTEWLNLTFEPPPNTLFCDYCFPTDNHRKEYIATINVRSDEEIRRLLLKFLISSSTLGSDQRSLEYFLMVSPDEKKYLLSFQYYRRLIQYSANSNRNAPPWEGITWILDLLPHWPKMALEGLNAYMLANIQFLPDGRIEGLYDAAEVIRAKFIGLPGSQAERIQFLQTLQPRNFECIVERLYHSMQYDTELTPPRKDGGRDIIAVRQSVGQREKILIECKRYIEDPVDVERTRALLGVVSDEKANKGVLVTTSRFTEPATEFADRNPLELIDGNALILLLNEYLGLSWPLDIERLVLESESKSRVK